MAKRKKFHSGLPLDKFLSLINSAGVQNSSILWLKSGRCILFFLTKNLISHFLFLYILIKFKTCIIKKNCKIKRGMSGLQHIYLKIYFFYKWKIPDLGQFYCSIKITKDPIKNKSFEEEMISSSLVLLFIIEYICFHFPIDNTLPEI